MNVFFFIFCLVCASHTLHAHFEQDAEPLSKDTPFIRLRWRGDNSLRHRCVTLYHPFFDHAAFDGKPSQIYKDNKGYPHENIAFSMKNFGNGRISVCYEPHTRSHAWFQNNDVFRIDFEKSVIFKPYSPDSMHIVYWTHGLGEHTEHVAEDPDTVDYSLTKKQTCSFITDSQEIFLGTAPWSSSGYQLQKESIPVTMHLQCDKSFSAVLDVKPKITITSKHHDSRVIVNQDMIFSGSNLSTLSGAMKHEGKNAHIPYDVDVQYSPFQAENHGIGDANYTTVIRMNIHNIHAPAKLPYGVYKDTIQVRVDFE